jgi:hypothetical protein
VGQGHPDTASAFESLTKVLRKMGKDGSNAWGWVKADDFHMGGLSD